ncbi:oxidoreductase, short chain dehydrogenase/reductase family protein, partial [Oesophagostomum dentatum]
DVTEKVIVITGAASGLGRRMSQILAIEKGARLIIIDVDIKGAEETVSSIIKENGHAEAYFCDIRKEEEMQRVAAEIHEKYVVVDDAMRSSAHFEFTTFFCGIFNINMKMWTSLERQTIRAFLEPMIKTNSGHVVAVSSIAGFSGETFGLAYW